MLKKGLTLLEILLVVAIIIIVAAGVPALSHFQAGANLAMTGGSVGRFLRQAQVDAESGYLNQPHGLKLFSDKVIMFTGESYADRLTDYDRELSLANETLTWSLTGSGQADEIIFAKNTGRPSRQGRLTLSDNQSSVLVDINTLGLVEWTNENNN